MDISVLTKETLRAGDEVQWLSVLAILPEDQNLILSTHIKLLNSSGRGSTTSGFPSSCIHVYTLTHNTTTQLKVIINLKKKNRNPSGRL